MKVEEGNELGSVGAVEELAEVGGEVEGGRGGELGVPRKHLPAEKFSLIALMEYKRPIGKKGFCHGIKTDWVDVLAYKWR